MAKKWNTSKPLKMWIDGNCFNIKPYDKLKNSFGERNVVAKETESPAQVLENNYVIKSTDDGKLATRFRLPSRYYKGLTNFPQFSLKCLGQETQTEIAVPSKEADYLTISGTNETDIVNARELIQSVVGQIREKESIQQFVAIPVHSEEVRKNFEQFRDEIINGGPIKGMDVSIFQSPLKLHLTIAVFSLLDDLEKGEATAALNECKTQIIEPLIREAKHPIKIKVSGIDCMNDDLSKVNILYANAKIEHESEENILQNVANGISNFFYDRGLIRQYQDNVKLHVTLINTKYRKVTGEGNLAASPRRFPKWDYKRKPFDARSIIAKYKDHSFGEAVFDSVHLCHISSVGEDGFYKPLSVVTI